MRNSATDTITTFDLALDLCSGVDATFIVATGELATLTDGYVVGQAAGVASFVAYRSEINPHAVADWLRSLPCGVVYVGCWQEDEHIFIDASEVVMDRDEALNLASGRGELAIYDVVNRACITVGAEDEQGTLDITSCVVCGDAPQADSSLCGGCYVAASRGDLALV